jgi:acyl-coenzyme A synthetase/AMP-(fatty) acid ligase
MNVLDHVLFQCRFHPTRPAICVPGSPYEIVSYARLEQLIHAIGGKARSLGLSAGNVVGLYVQDSALQAALILALTRIGVVTFSGRVETIPAELRVDAVIADQPYPFLAGQRVILADQSFTTGDGAPLDAPPPAATDLCRIVLTSGTVGASKAVALTQQMVADRVARHISVFGGRFADCSTILCNLALNTSLGFQFLIYTLARGGTLVMLGDTFDHTLQALESYKAQCWITSPAGLATMLRLHEQADAAPGTLELVISAGDVLPRSLSEQARGRLCAHMISLYGSTEAGFVATAPVHAIEHVSGAVGYVTPGIAVEIVDALDRPLAVGREGAVRIRSAVGVDGYLGNPAESDIAFRGGWFYPGDVGSLTVDNLLVISGRQKAVLNLGGEKINPEAIEEVLRLFPGIEQAAAFGAPDELGVDHVAAAIVARQKIDGDQLRAHCRTYLPPSFVPADFFSVDDLPRNEMGKIDRIRLPQFTLQRFNALRA